MSEDIYLPITHSCAHPPRTCLPSLSLPLPLHLLSIPLSGSPCISWQPVGWLKSHDLALRLLWPSPAPPFSGCQLHCCLRITQEEPAPIPLSPPHWQPPLTKPHLLDSPSDSGITGSRRDACVRLGTRRRCISAV